MLQHFCRNFSIVDEHVREAMGETLYDLFMVSPSTVFLTLPITLKIFLCDGSIQSF
jgi:hypothetical protein